jgi:hypothetical protein
VRTEVSAVPNDSRALPLIDSPKIVDVTLAGKGLFRKEQTDVSPPSS